MQEDLRQACQVCVSNKGWLKQESGAIGSLTQPVVSRSSSKRWLKHGIQGPPQSAALIAYQLETAKQPQRVLTQDSELHNVSK